MTAKRVTGITFTQGDARGMFYDLFDADEAAELTMRAGLLRGLQAWFDEASMTQVAAAKELSVTQPRISDIKRDEIGSVSLDLLVHLASHAGMKPQLHLAA